MSSPSKDSQGKDHEEKDKEDKLSVEEVGGACSNPALHQEEQNRIYKAVVCMVRTQNNFGQRQPFNLFFLYGTKQEIERQFIKIKEICVESNEPVPFIGEVSPDDDNYTFQVPICGQGCVKIRVEVNPEKCYCCFKMNEVLVSIPEINEKSTRCLHGTPTRKTRLKELDLPAYTTFFLLCKQPSQLRTPMTFKLILNITDTDGQEIFGNHTVEHQYAANFCNADAAMEKAGNSSTDKSILTDNYSKICKMMQNGGSIIKKLVSEGVLEESFLKYVNDSSLSKETKGEILRNLYQVENIVPIFIEALETSGGNKELITLLHQCMENQSSSLE